MPNSLTDALDRNYRYVVLMASVAILMIGSGATFILVVVLKPIAQEFSWPRSVPSLAYSLQYFCGGLGGIAMGHWLDRFGMKMPTRMAAVMIGSGGLLASVISTQWELYLIYGGMMGFLGHGALFSPLMANVLGWFEQRRGSAVGIVASGQTLAGVVWPPIFHHFNETIGWRDTYFWFGVFALCTMLPLSLVFRRKPPQAIAPTPPQAAGSGAPGNSPGVPDVPGDGRPLPAAPLSPTMLQALLCAAIIGCCVAMSLPLAHVVSYASDLGHPTARAAEMLAIMLACSTISRFFVIGPMADRFGGLGALFAFSTVQATMMLAFAVVDGLIGLYIIAAVFGLGYSGIIPCYSITVRELLPPGEVGRRTATVIFFGAIGMATGGWLGGFVYDLAGSYRPAFLIVFVCNLAQLGIVGYLLHRIRRSGLRIAAA